jgi:hypothetical protein
MRRQLPAEAFNDINYDDPKSKWLAKAINNGDRIVILRRRASHKANEFLEFGAIKLFGK